jgi:hypothetical protein
MLVLPRGKVRLQTSCSVKATNLLPLVGLARSSKTQASLGMVLSVYTAPASRGQEIMMEAKYKYGCPILAVGKAKLCSLNSSIL